MLTIARFLCNMLEGTVLVKNAATVCQQGHENDGEVLWAIHNVCIMYAILGQCTGPLQSIG